MQLSGQLVYHNIPESCPLVPVWARFTPSGGLSVEKILACFLTPLSSPLSLYLTWRLSHMVLRYRFLTLLVFLLTPVLAYGQDAHKTAKRSSVEAPRIMTSITGNRVACQQGMAGGFPCSEIDLMSFTTVQALLGGVNVQASITNDIWGWEDPQTGVEYALVGMNTGTSFVDITDATNPRVVGFLPTHTNGSTWRDVKVYNNHAFIVADAAGLHGMQVFDLTQLRSVSGAAVLFDETAHYDNFGSAHNIVINEETGYAYAVGIGSGGTTCGGGLHMINIQNPTAPVFAGCYADASTGRRGTGYTHDAQCVMYNGPDVEHQGKEICFGSNETALNIADVTDKGNPQRLSSAAYPSVAYAHQGWLSEDHRYFFLDDELDEPNLTANTRTIIWDVQDLDDPVVANTYLADSRSRDHNQYVKGNFLYQSNYTSGLRILDISDPVNPVEVAFFDVLPQDASTAFNGSWSNYPYFESGKVVATSIDEGLFILEPVSAALTSSADEEQLPSRTILAPPYPNPFTTQTEVTLQLERSQHVDIEVYDLLGRKVEIIFSGVIAAHTLHQVTFNRGNLPAGEYIIRARGENLSLVRTVMIVR